MSALRKSPWTLRVYAVILIALAVTESPRQAALPTLIRLVLAIGLCQGSRLVWWFLVVSNALILTTAPFLLHLSWYEFVVNVVGLICLLAPQSRHFVFPPTEPEPLSSQQA
jgi:hypothetical protein